MKKKASIINFGIDMKSYLLCAFAFLMLLCLAFKVSITNASGFSCDTGTLSDTCTVSSLKTITADDVISGSGNLVVANGGELRVATSSSISIILGGDITIQSGGKITGNLSLASSINLTIDAGGLINLNGKGYTGGIGGQGTTCSGCDGNGKYTLYNSSYYGGGGAHGGNGSPGFYSSSNLAIVSGGTSYGSTTAPTDFGSGGAGENATYYGGNGGGAIKIVVSGAFTNNGNISTNGLSSGNGGGASYPGGGAGGSIWIQANTISGSGTATADGGGGRVSTQWGGGGGGGRIALYYTTDNSTLILSAKGGGSAGSDSRTFGGAGTIYRKQSSWASGDLTIDNGGYGSLSYSTTQFNDPIYAFGTTSVRGGSALVFSTSTSININTSVLNLANGNVTLSNNTTFSATTFNITSGSSTLNVIATTTNIPSFTDITISSGASLSHATSTHALIFNANNLTINSGGTINVTGKGYSGGIGGQGTTCSGCDGNGRYSLYSSTYFGSGGAYGGNGAASMSNANFIAYGGTAYGSTTAPTDLGSGGAGENATHYGGNGGGAVKITVSGTLTNNGQILANGSSGGSGAGTSYPGGGSGGSIWITTGTLSGTGTTSANGGSGKISGNIFGGGGGGGRIALYFTTDNSSQVVTSKGGGYSSDQRSIAGAGTIYKKQSSWTNGDLTIDNGGYGTIEYATTPILANLTLGTTTVRNSANLTFSTSANVTLNAGNLYLNSGNVNLSSSTIQSIIIGTNMYVSGGTSTLNVMATTTNPPVFNNVNILSGGNTCESNFGYNNCKELSKFDFFDYHSGHTKHGRCVSKFCSYYTFNQLKHA
jgi:hypothetical protein